MSLYTITSRLSTKLPPRFSSRVFSLIVLTFLIKASYLRPAFQLSGRSLKLEKKSLYFYQTVSWRRLISFEFSQRKRYLCWVSFYSFQLFHIDRPKRTEEDIEYNEKLDRICLYTFRSIHQWQGLKLHLTAWMWCSRTSRSLLKSLTDLCVFLGCDLSIWKYGSIR